MNARVVVDASALVAVLLDSGPDGEWATEALHGAKIAAPSVLFFETANIIRRHELSGLIGADQAQQAHADLCDLAIESWPYQLLAARSFELRLNLSIYDATYVALAELIETALVTLDQRIAAAPNLRCRVCTPPARPAR